MRTPFVLASISFAALLNSCDSTTITPAMGAAGGTDPNGAIGGAANSSSATKITSTNNGTGGTKASSANSGKGGNTADGGSESNDTTNSDTGGNTTSNGGKTNTNTTVSTGGKTNANTTVSTGGKTNANTTISTGGKTNANTTISTGGKTNTDTTVSTGGKTNTGGTSNTGGSSSSSAPNTSAIGCDRAGLEAAVNSYLEAIAAGSYSSLPLTSSAKYIENDKTVALGQGLWQAPLKVDFHRNLIDVTECATFTEIIVTDASHPYVIGTRLKVSSGQISEIYAVVTDKGDWLFDANAYLKYSSKEDWSEVPADQRLTRQELHDAGYAYFAYWKDKSVAVPWGKPCARLEGGAYTGDSTCSVGIPDDGFAPQPREYLVDVDYGMVVLFLNLGGTDSHLFRVLTTGMRYVHTLTQQ